MTEVTDDKKLEKLERKRIQIEKAPHLSSRAKVIKIADKIANLTDLIVSPPAHWSLGCRQEYLVWSNQVIAECRAATSSSKKSMPPELWKPMFGWFETAPQQETWEQDSCAYIGIRLPIVRTAPDQSVQCTYHPRNQQSGS